MAGSEQVVHRVGKDSRGGGDLIANLFRLGLENGVDSAVASRIIPLSQRWLHGLRNLVLLGRDRRSEFRSGFLHNYHLRSISISCGEKEEMNLDGSEDILTGERSDVCGDVVKGSHDNANIIR